MQRKFDFSIDEYYHVYSRGVDRRIIFNDDHDYKRFVMLLYLCNSDQSLSMRDVFLSYRGRSFFENVFTMDRGKTIVDIGAYCLMPNHFHIFLREKSANGISIFMKKLLTAYSKYFNETNERTGTLFEGRFKAEHVDGDRYLKYLFAYIHLNPVKIVAGDWKEKGIKNHTEVKKFLATYFYSSYLEYAGGKRPQGTILQMEKFPNYFISSEDFIRSLNEWFQLNPNKI